MEEEVLEDGWVKAEKVPVARNRIEAFGRLAVALAFVVLVGLIAARVVDADAVQAAVTAVLAIASLVLVWWKDNNVTLRAILRHQVGIEIKEDTAGDDEAGWGYSPMYDGDDAKGEAR